MKLSNEDLENWNMLILKIEDFIGNKKFWVWIFIEFKGKYGEDWLNKRILEILKI